MENHKKIQCHFCEREFAPDEFYGFSPVQTDGCASFACEEGVASFDGSKFDMIEFCWTAEAKIEIADESVVCDQCIENWLRKNWLVPIRFRYGNHSLSEVRETIDEILSAREKAP